MKKKTRLILISLLFVGAFISFPVIHVFKTWMNEVDVDYSIPVGYSNDASFLSLTKVDTVIQIPSNSKDLIKELKEILSYAKENDLKISIAGAKHSMGGHTLYPGGIVINMLGYNKMELNVADNILTIGAGALWSEAISYLDKYHKSIAVMQAFSSFSIGGSLSVNGHGWQKNLPPLASSVLSFTVLNANGKLINCSRTENSELFGLVIGGYGLFGVILDVKLKVVNNNALVFRSQKLKTIDYLNEYEKLVTNNPNTEMVFGRLRVTEKNFLEDVTLNYFERSEEKPKPISPDKFQEIKRLVFRSSVGNQYGKKLRWDLELVGNKIFRNTIFSRNELLNAQVELIENKDSLSTDILHEYFIPESNFVQFIEDVKPIFLNSNIDLLNITLRRVEKDNDAFLNYARESVYGFVLLFNQKLTPEQESEMHLLTNNLVDAAIKNKGTYYLPYRLHISREKMRTVYPQADSFFALKLKYDSLEVFNNSFYAHYH